jgi:hypothetical protein
MPAGFSLRHLIALLILAGVGFKAVTLFTGGGYFDFDWRAAERYEARSRQFVAATLDGLLRNCTADSVGRAIAPKRRDVLDDAYLGNFCSTLSQQFGGFQAAGGVAPDVTGYLTNGNLTNGYFASALYAKGAPLVWIAAARYGETWFVVELDHDADDPEPDEAADRQFAAAALESILRNCASENVAPRLRETIDAADIVELCRKFSHEYGEFRGLGEIKRHRGKKYYNISEFIVLANYERQAPLFDIAVSRCDDRRCIDHLHGYGQ